MNKIAVIKSFSKTLEKLKPQIKLVLPRHLDVDRICRIAFTEFRKNMYLQECHPTSVLAAIMQASQLGLEIGGPLGHSYLVPYGKSCQFIVGYRGMIDLARRSGQIISIIAQAVYENDEFEFEYGIQEKLRHVPAKGDRGQFLAAYAIAKLQGGGYQFDVMFNYDIDKIKMHSKTANRKDSPWNEHYEEMAKKTVVRRLFKYLPVSAEIAKASALDEAADYGTQSEFNICESGIEEVTELNPENHEEEAFDNSGQEKIKELVNKLSD